MAAYYKKIGLSVNKEALKNVIKHTDSHNQIKEEEFMWRLHDRQKETTRSEMVTEHMYSDRRKPPEIAGPFTRQLMTLEEKDPERWGHSGYAELYPDEFSEKNNDKTSKKKDNHKKRKRKRTDSFDDNDHHIKRHKDKKKKKEKKKKSKRKKSS